MEIYHYFSRISEIILNKLFDNLNSASLCITSVIHLIILLLCHFKYISNDSGICIFLLVVPCYYVYQLKKQNKELEIKKSKNEELEKEKQKLEKELESNKSENKELKKEKQKLEQELESNKSENQELKKENQKLDKELESNKSENKELKKEKQKLEQELINKEVKGLRFIDLSSNTSQSKCLFCNRDTTNCGFYCQNCSSFMKPPHMMLSYDFLPCCDGRGFGRKPHHECCNNCKNGRPFHNCIT